MNNKNACLILSIALLSGACSETTQEQAAQHPPPAAASAALTVLDTFSVGEGVVVRSLAIEPKRDAIWVGTSAGVLEIDVSTQALKDTFTRDHGLANEYVFAIGIDSQGYKWFGTNSGGVSRYRDGEWKTYFPMHGLADYWIYAFAEQADQTLWIGTWAGVNAVDLNTLKFRTYVDQLINEWVYGIGIDSKQRLWFGTEGGVTRFDGTQWQHWTHDDGLGAKNTHNLPLSQNTGLGTRSRHDLSVVVGGQESYNPNYVFCVQVMPDDTVWFGTWGGGAAHFDGERWRNFTVDEGLSGNIVYTIAKDSQDVLWFGTNNGVSRFDGKQWQHLGRDQGLISNDVYALAVTGEGDVWAGMRGGVVRIGTRR